MSSRPRRWPAAPATALLLLLAILSAPAARADGTPESRAQQAEAAREAARKALVHGPADVRLKDQAQLALPEGFGYIPREPAAALMRVMGNGIDDTFLGLIVPLERETDHWLVSLHFEPSGYVKDDDAKHWNADELLQSLKDGTEAGNERRVSMGIPAIKVTRWIEPPAYDSATHRLVWAAEVKNKEGQDDDPGVNYNTYVLGREGYVSLNLVTSEADVERDKGAARQLLGFVKYDGGKDYGSFNSSTDKVAAYGLAALVAGVAAKKLGLLAVAGAFIVKFAKVILVAVAAFGAGIAKWFKARFKRGGEPAA